LAPERDPSAFSPKSNIHLCYMPYQSYLRLLNHYNYTWWIVHVTKLFIMQFSPPSCHFILLRSILSVMFSHTLSQRFSPNVRDKVSHPCMYVYMNVYIQVSQEKSARLRKGVPCVKVCRCNAKHLCPKFNGYGDNSQINFKR
jgi:hypothetical protein